MSYHFYKKPGAVSRPFSSTVNHISLQHLTELYNALEKYTKFEHDDIPKLNGALQKFWS